jgi:hypothetical protein
MIFVDCEICWGTNGFRVRCSDFGAATQICLRGCKFHNLTAECVGELVGAGGSAAVTFRNFEVTDGTFDDNEGGAAPTKYFLLNGDNGNDGIAANNRIPAALASGTSLVSTAFHWVSNFHTGGVSTTVPS